MQITRKQAYVFANLDRVVPRPYQHHSLKPTRRYQLDGEECTQAINGLIVKGQIRRLPSGHLNRSGERHRPSPEAFKLIREALLQPGSVHRDPLSASAKAAALVAGRPARIAP